MLNPINIKENKHEAIAKNKGKHGDFQFIAEIHNCLISPNHTSLQG
jgi:hypothetical protein